MSDGVKHPASRTARGASGPGQGAGVGPAPADVPTAAAALGCDGVTLAWTPCPRERAAARVMAAALPVTVVDEPPLCDRSRIDDLRRFSRYWQKVRDSALRPTAQV